MSTDPRFHHRKSIRLLGYDYTAPGAYYITLAAHRHQKIFGEIADGEMRLNEIGNIIEDCWCEIPNVYRHVEIDEFVVMPNHLHGIIILHENIQPIRNVGATQWVAPTNHWVAQTNPVAPTKPITHPNPTNGGGRNTIVSGSIGSIIGQFKSAATKRIHQCRNMTNVCIWQRNYYEHIVRDTDELLRIRTYIRDNPIQWEIDAENRLSI